MPRLVCKAEVSGLMATKFGHMEPTPNYSSLHVTVLLRNYVSGLRLWSTQDMICSGIDGLGRLSLFSASESAAVFLCVTHPGTSNVRLYCAPLFS